MNAVGTNDEEDLVKSRVICFCRFHPDPHQARTALPLLKEVEGIHEAQQVAERCLKVVYDLTQVCLEQVEEALIASGFHLDNSLMSKLRRGLYYYTESNQRELLGCPRGDTNCVQRVFINRYARLQHGCRDERPDYWREYL